jgi:hypothetical protein
MNYLTRSMDARLLNLRETLLPLLITIKLVKVNSLRTYLEDHRLPLLLHAEPASPTDKLLTLENLKLNSIEIKS